MFKCGKCGDQVEARQPQNHIVTQKRHRNYENFIKRNYERKVIYSQGWEIVKELAVCPPCYTKHTGMAALVKEPEPERKPQFKPRDNRPRNPYEKKNFKGRQDRGQRPMGSNPQQVSKKPWTDNKENRHHKHSAQRVPVVEVINSK